MPRRPDRLPTRIQTPRMSLPNTNSAGGRPQPEPTTDRRVDTLNTIIPQEMPATMSNGMTTDRVSHRGRANTAWPHTHQPTTAPEIGRATPASTVTRKPVARKRLTIYLPVDLLERARNTVYWTSGTTLAGLIEQALSHTLDSRESLNGGRF